MSLLLLLLLVFYSSEKFDRWPELVSPLGEHRSFRRSFQHSCFRFVQRDTYFNFKEINDWFMKYTCLFVFEISQNILI